MSRRSLGIDVLEERTVLSTSDPTIAIVFDHVPVGAAQQAQVVAAIRTQVQRQLAPAWGVSANIVAYTQLSHVPSTDWVVDLKFADSFYFLFFEGWHYVETNGLPAANVHYDVNWTINLSHEVMEMLIDPSGTRQYWVGPANAQKGYLQEVCDPVDHQVYSIHGVQVSDFVTPAYYTGEGTVYDHMGMAKRPLTVTRGGYMAYQEQGSAQWWEQSWFGGKGPTIEKL